MKLKPCPFCGGLPNLLTGDEGGHYVSCFDCYCVIGESYSLSGSRALGIVTFGVYETERKAINAWNKRVIK